MSFNECELAILRSSVDTIDKKIAKNIIDSPEIKKRRLMKFYSFKKISLLWWNSY